MRENYNGFTLIEVVISFGLILTFIFYFIPEWINLTEHRETLKVKADMMDILHNETQGVLFDDVPPPFEGKVIRKNGQEFEFKVTKQPGSPFLKACVSHSGENGARIERCTYVEK